MKHLVALIMAGVMAVLLTGCGEQAPKQPDVKIEQTTLPAQEQPAAQPEATVAQPEATVAQPADNSAAEAGATSPE